MNDDEIAATTVYAHVQQMPHARGNRIGKCTSKRVWGIRNETPYRNVQALIKLLKAQNAISQRDIQTKTCIAFEYTSVYRRDKLVINEK